MKFISIRNLLKINSFYYNNSKKKFCESLLTRYEKLAKQGGIEHTDSQIGLIKEFDLLKVNLESNKTIYDSLRTDMIEFWDKEKEDELKEKEGGFNLFGMFQSKPKPKAKPAEEKKDGIKIRTMREFVKYEEMLNKYKSLNSIKGVYVFGTPGCGKTYLMDMFYDNVKFPRKKRTHFNEFMLEVHDNLHKLRSKITYKNSDMDPLYILATEMAKDYHLICFDEFQVTDIADAVILKRLFEVLYKNYVVTIATSNRHPDNLYLNGLQRHLFLPFIEELKVKNKIISISSKDFRIRHDIIQEKYLYPINMENTLKIENTFQRLINNNVAHSKVIDVMQGRKFICEKYFKGVGMFQFDELCDRPVGSADYIAIAQQCPTVVIRDIPYFSVNNRNLMRRFITLIDELYNHNVKIYCLGADKIEKLFKKEEGTEEHYDEVFAFERCVSRLMEMQTEYYFKEKQHKFYCEANEELKSQKIQEVI